MTKNLKELTQKDTPYEECAYTLQDLIGEGQSLGCESSADEETKDLVGEGSTIGWCSE